MLYFAGCMTHLTPRILRSVEVLFRKARLDYAFADRDGGICCGRPLMLAGRVDAAAETVAANKRMIEASGCNTLVLSCPICYKIFNEEYGLSGIRVVHYTQFIKELLDGGKLSVTKGNGSVVYHDPCELGRGCGVYAEPRAVLGRVAELENPSKNGDESVCCGGSLGSLTLNANDRKWITAGSVSALLKAPDGKPLHPDALVTACPLCLKTFGEAAPVPVKDFAEIILEHSA